ncbi:probable tubulin polyglutamylase TTLL2 isoform X2 [Rhodnius prolixus]|uniref:probable tubulin polyglutamylase TTLL2 isoform X2 n=1 Tax=Rhodnius prolixus TaxID=13249 RepID=UPI003D18A259
MVCLERGWQEYSDENVTKERWNIWWRTTGFPVAQCKSLKKWQFTNYIPKAYSICRKDKLSRYLKRMRNNYGHIFDFSPDAFVLPSEYLKLVEVSSPLDVWIVKPVGLSQGRGISLFRKVSELNNPSHSVVQRYIQNPLLIGGYKFDLRLYVCVPSFHPLTVYAYREGLARFSTDKFSLNDLSNKYAHLTNCSVNKQGPGYLEMKDKVGAGCKWSLKQLRYYLNQNGYDDWLLWQRINKLIVLTVASQLSGVPHTSNSFVFYGFDVLIDVELKPWLLEVNLSPGLCTDCDIDPAVKKPMLHDMFDLLGLPVCNTGLSVFSYKGASIYSESDSSSDEDYMSYGKNNRTSASFVALAHKWKKQITPTSNRTKIKENSVVSKLHSSSFNRNRKGCYEPKNPLQTSDMKKQVQARREESSLSKWGNGRDWREPPSSFGDWCRLYPYFNVVVPSYCISKECSEPPNDKGLRPIITEVSKYFKMAREVFIKYKSADDHAKNFAMKEELKVSEAIWHPTVMENYKQTLHSN